MAYDKLSPKVIKEWCVKHPGALEKMIAMYGKMQYDQAISDLMRIGSDLRHIETGAAVILAPLHDFDNWKAGNMCPAKFDAMRVPQKNERVMMYASDYEYISNCCSATMKDPETSDVCPKCKEHCNPVLAELNNLI